MGDERHAEDVFGMEFGIGLGACNLHAAAFSATSGVNLGLDDDA